MVVAGGGGTLAPVARTVDAAPGVRAIDTRMCDRDRVTSAYLVEAERPALVETGPTT